MGWKRWLAFGVLFVILLSMGLDRAGAQGPNQAGLVVQYGDGSVSTHCISFSESQITGWDLLQRAGLDVEIAVEGGMGAAVCRIGPDGCPANDCFCQSPPDFWSYWHFIDDSWVYSAVGVSAWMVQPGTVDGFAWGPGDPPPNIAFESICVPAGPAPTDTQLPSSTPTLTETTAPTQADPTPTVPAADTATPQPTNTIPPTATQQPAPSQTPIPSATTPPTATPTHLPTNTPQGSEPPPASPRPSVTFTAGTGTPLALAANPDEEASGLEATASEEGPATATPVSITPPASQEDPPSPLTQLGYAVFGVLAFVVAAGSMVTYILLRKPE